VFDTSIVHQTENTSDRERYVLLVRFWHPDLTEIEREAFNIIFQYLDYSALGDDALSEFEEHLLFMGKDMHKVQAEQVTKRCARHFFYDLYQYCIFIYILLPAAGSSGGEAAKESQQSERRRLIGNQKEKGKGLISGSKEGIRLQVKGATILIDNIKDC
jgi:Aspartyl/Asparaginyl beta-hydroxylase